MRALILCSGAGPAEGRLIEAAGDAGHEVDLLDVGGHRWLRRRRGLPPAPLLPWTGTLAFREAGNAVARETRRALETGDYDLVLASGLAACGFAARYVEERFVPLLWRGDLDFSAARVHATEDFHRLTSAVDRIFLDDEWEFDKALSKDSRSAHLRHPHRAAPEHDEPLLGAPGEAGADVLVLHPEKVDAERLANQLAALATVPGARIRSASVSSLLRTRDVLQGRRPWRVARTRLGGATHVVLVGASRDHEPVAELLVADGAADRLVVEDTVGMGQWALSRPEVRTGRGPRLVAEVAAAVRGERRVAASPDPVHARPVVPDLLAHYAEAMDRPVERTFEDLAALRHEGPVEVFFSTSPLEDRTDGARPQRVRNMAEAMDAVAPAVRISSVPQVFDRRALLVRRALAEGRPAGLLYGENSTSPIRTPRIRDGVAELMRDMRAAGGRAAWFVRDLHWLDDLEGYLEDEEHRERTRREGLAELDAVSAAVDVLAAPSRESGAGFDELLRRHGQPTRDWFPLPPGVAPQNTVPPGRGLVPAGEDGVTLLYAGGVSSIYGLEQYLDAAASLEETVRLDFVVRAGERPLLEEMLERHGLAGRDRVRISTVALEWYVPATRTVIGAVLLGGDYARFSFPYKTMSLVERGCPILCFADMAIAPFVEGEGLGAAVARDAGSIRAGLEQLLRDGAPGLQEAQSSQTWAARMAGLRERVGLATPSA